MAIKFLKQDYRYDKFKTQNIVIDILNRLKKIKYNLQCTCATRYIGFLFYKLIFCSLKMQINVSALFKKIINLYKIILYFQNINRDEGTHSLPRVFELFSPRSETTTTVETKLSGLCKSKSWIIN